MSAEFYSEEINRVVTEVTSDTKKMDAGEMQWTIPAIDNMIEKINGARDALQELESQMVLVSTNEKNTYQSLITNYSKQIEMLEEKLQINKKRVKILGNTRPAIKERQEAVLLNETNQIMSETVDIGNGILSSLKDQRTKLLNVHENVTEIDHTVDETGNVVSRMFKRHNKNKLLTYLVVFLLVFGILLLLYLKFT